MGARRPNPRLAKIHRNYMIDEIALLLDVHDNTVRRWRKEGLPAIDDRRPTLIRGADLREFLERRRREVRRPLEPGQVFCLKCRQPRWPAFDEAECLTNHGAGAVLRALCPVCTSVMNRRVSGDQLAAFRQILAITSRQDESSIDDT